MFADPQIVNNGTAVTLPRTGSGVDAGVFRSADGTVRLFINHEQKKRSRSRIRAEFSQISADPLVAGQSNEVSMSVTLVVDSPKQGFTPDQEQKNAAALLTLLTAGTNAKLIQFLGGES